MNELKRQIVHIVFGLLVVASFLLFGKEVTLAALIASILIGFILSTLKLMKKNIGFFEHTLTHFERKEVMPFEGAIAYLAGVLFALTFAPEASFALGAVMILAFGDGFATLFGVRSKTNLPWNKKKSWTGLIAFIVVGGIAAFPFLGAIGFAYAVVCGLAESLSIGIDDNILVPVVAVLARML